MFKAWTEKWKPAILRYRSECAGSVSRFVADAEELNILRGCSLWCFGLTALKGDLSPHQVEIQPTREPTVSASE
jgi:hypothetical protein